MTRKLLVADDSFTIQRVVKLTFADEDVQVESVADGDQALARTRQLRPDLVLADVLMPGLSGYQVCAEIKADPELCNIPVVLMVGAFEPFDHLEAGRVKCDAYLTKPFDTSELLQTFKTLVSKEGGNAGARSAGIAGAPPADESASKRARRFIRSQNLVSDRARESFLGENRVLDLISPEAGEPVAGSEAAAPQIPGTAPNVLHDIIESVVRRLTTDIVREIAWEVVPEMSELMIRRSLEENPPAKG